MPSANPDISALKPILGNGVVGFAGEACNDHVVMVYQKVVDVSFCILRTSCTLWAEAAVLRFLVDTAMSFASRKAVGGSTTNTPSFCTELRTAVHKICDPRHDFAPFVANGFPKTWW